MAVGVCGPDFVPTVHVVLARPWPFVKALATAKLTEAPRTGIPPAFSTRTAIAPSRRRVLSDLAAEIQRRRRTHRWREGSDGRRECFAGEHCPITSPVAAHAAAIRDQWI